MDEALEAMARGATAGRIVRDVRSVQRQLAAHEAGRCRPGCSPCRVEASLRRTWADPI